MGLGCGKHSNGHSGNAKGVFTRIESANLKLYFLVGKLSQANLKPVYQSALNILKKASSSAEVFSETEAADLSLRLAAQVTQHKANATHA